MATKKYIALRKTRVIWKSNAKVGEYLESTQGECPLCTYTDDLPIKENANNSCEGCPWYNNYGICKYL